MLLQPRIPDKHIILQDSAVPWLEASEQHWVPSTTSSSWLPRVSESVSAESLCVAAAGTAAVSKQGEVV